MKVLGVFLILCVSTVLLGPSNPKIKAIPLKDAGSRIIHGEDAEAGQFPWQAAVYFDANGLTYFCGGTLIDAEWLLTAGHCVDGATSFSVQLGSITVEDPDDNRVIVTTTESYLHPDYSEFTLANDIGLIKIPAVDFTDFIKALPISHDELLDGTDITVSGFGKTSDASTTISNQLKFVNLHTISNEDCSTYYGDIVIDDMVCALGETNESTCNGDSGGPVIATVDGESKHVAIVSFVSSGGCEIGYPSGYTRSQYYLDWIRETTGLDL